MGSETFKEIAADNSQEKFPSRNPVASIAFLTPASQTVLERGGLSAAGDLVHDKSYDYSRWSRVKTLADCPSL